MGNREGKVDNHQTVEVGKKNGLMPGGESFTKGFLFVKASGNVADSGVHAAAGGGRRK